MRANKKAIKSGIYLVIDPSMDEHLLLEKMRVVLKKKISAVQIWDNFKTGQDMPELIHKICVACADYQTPVLINNHWECLRTTEIDGVHFDTPPDDLDKIRKQLNRDCIMGLTCGNDLADVKWAASHDIDYISFCSMFPSSSAGNCTIIDYETIQKASVIFYKPLFLAGGIYPENLKELSELKYDGIALISGIMNSDHPDLAVDEYRKNLRKTK